MSQTIKFVDFSGKVRLVNTSIDLTKEGIKLLQHDFRAHHFVLADGEYAPEFKKAKPVRYQAR